jgi:hypothetical protein
MRSSLRLWSSQYRAVGVAIQASPGRAGAATGQTPGLRSRIAVAAERGDIGALVERGHLVAARRQARLSMMLRQVAIAQFLRTRSTESPLDLSLAGILSRQVTLQNETNTETNSSCFD